MTRSLPTLTGRSSKREHVLVIDSAGPGSDIVNGTDGSDTIYATTTGRTGDQIHILAGAGEDIIHLNLAVEGLPTIQHGHHVFGGTGADTFRFTNLHLTRGTVIGRIDDLTQDDSLFIGDQRVDLSRPAAIKGFCLQVVFYEGQQWLEMRNFSGGRALYNLEGARQQKQPDGTWADEGHFMAWNHKLPAVLPVVRYEDPFNFIPVHLKVSFRADHDLSARGDIATAVKQSGTQQNDLIITRRGSDLISGGAGNDSLDGYMGNDTIYGGPGKDLIEGGKGRDSLSGQSGHDIIAGGTDDDMLAGEEGNDTLFGGSENDLLIGAAGADLLRGGTGKDILRGGRGADKLVGGGGPDVLVGDDRPQGSAHGGNDQLLGGAGNDTLWGGTGADALIGGLGNDQLYGGAGADIFAFAAHDSCADVIMDFTRGDRIDLSSMDLALVSRFSGKARQLTLQDTTAGERLQADLNGDAVADFSLTLTGAVEYARAAYVEAIIF